MDADWAGNWIKHRPNETTGALSRTGYPITYVNCPIVWGSKMQMLVALSSTEAEIIALSTALREVIHLQKSLEELHEFKIPSPLPYRKSNAEHLRTMPHALKSLNRNAKFGPERSIFRSVFFIFATTLNAA